ncbi:mitotic interactor and substrate of PLK1 isoform X1 [Pseudonaja textilis]|uniref:Mitotic spindle positioning n=2 Tax=Pseudonaja textilis TaxID=8673 RepID=A0A670Y1Y9_PSETE|nr:mitotic interactor and substrate of PLK1 isoform X1 [Pseudonaja textilis]
MWASRNGSLSYDQYPEAGPEHPAICSPQLKQAGSRASLFKYTPPWQVFCAALGSKLQNLQSPVVDANISQENWMTQEIPITKEHLPQTEDNIYETSLPKMKSSTRDINTPQNIELSYDNQHEHSSQEVVLQQEMRPEDKEGEILDLGRPELKVENGWKMLDPTEDQSPCMTKSISGKTDHWTPSPDRESKLEVLRSGSHYDIRAYKGERKPSRLYEEDEEELQYKIPSKNVSPEIAKELEDERQEIIRRQVVRKSNTMAEKWSSMNELEAIDTSSLVKVTREARKINPTSFALCFDNPSPDWTIIPVNPENIDTEQINFAAARQQFLALEKTNPKMLLDPKRHVPSPRELKTTGHAYGSKEPQNPEMPRNDKELDEYSQLRENSVGADLLILPQREASSYSGTTFLSAEKMPSDLEVDMSTGNVNERTFKKESGNPLAQSQDPAKEAEIRNETPIEREIRLAMEREENLWKERGVQRISTKDDLVEIRSKPLLSSPVSSPASSRKGKDKPLVSFYVQREIEQEAKREEDLQKEGRLLGMYDRGLRQELAERRKIFEREEEASPLPSLCKQKKQGELLETLHGDAATLCCNVDPSREGIASQNVNWSSEIHRPSAEPTLGKKNPGNEPPLKTCSTASSPKMNFPSRCPPCSQDLKAPRDTFVLKKQHLAIPVRKLQFSFSEDQAPQSLQRKEPKPQKPAPREELYTLKTWRPRTSILIDQDIQDALQRELELQEQRRKISLTAQELPSSRVSSQSSAASGETGRYSISSSPVFVPNSPVRFPTSPILYRPSMTTNSPESNFRRCQSPIQSRIRPKEDGKYAGIELNDEIDTEVVKSIKPICRRSALAQLWETGQIRNMDDDSD